MGGESKVFTLAEVSEHNHHKDCWLVIEGKVSVYDVTSYLADHPGGDQKDESMILRMSSTDQVRTTMEEFYIGNIDIGNIPTKVEFTPPKQANNSQDKSPKLIIKLLKFLVPLLILGLAVGIRFYTKSLSA
ncbi:hypothetical protein K2173_012835 [Erythroxylum novogranatense]|uniref:Cytochrome b5 heme-binding domain-containing protein n=1 Tax=Erythroxylum novogranatense TaxID=1862640 RepID=A0AAV8UD44_9ROSI|nr:hypothetical protein K2173_012835 [Erythroxylum novogranatense]